MKRGRGAGRAARIWRVAIRFAIAIGALVVGAAGGAGATAMLVQATVTVQYGLTDPVDLTGVGFANVNPVVVGDQLVSLRVGPIYFGKSPTVPFTTPSVTAFVKFYELRSVSAQSCFLSDLSHATTSPAKLTQNRLPIAGIARICLFDAGCPSTSRVDVDLTQNGTRGIGINWTITAGATTGFHLTFQHARWQLAPATLQQSTINGIATAMATGYVRGPLSNTSTAAKVGGSIQLITPSQVFTQGVPGGHSDTQALFTRLTLHFVPEPGSLLLLGPGVVGLALMGRRRMRR